MIRTIVSLEEEDKAWLESHARDARVSMSEMVRRAVHSYRRQQEAGEEVDYLLERTSGLWVGEDGLEYQRKVRDEWQR